MSSLKESTRKKLLDDMLRAVQNAGRFKVLVVDAGSLKILNSVLKMSDIQDEGVTLVEDLSKKRSPKPQYDALYFIQSSMDSVNKIVDDFRTIPPYATVNIFVTGELTDTMLNKLKQSPVGQYIQTLTELHIDYLAIESQVFNLGREKSIYSLYNPETPSHQDLELDQIARQVSTVFSSLGERPLIRFYDPNQVVENHGGSLKSLCAASASSSSSSSMSSLKSSSSYAYSSRGSSSSSSSVKLPISAKFANLLQQHIDKLSQNDPAFPSSTSAPTILIMDRSVDVIAPLLHEFSYQAMISDFIGIEEGNKIRWEGDGSVNGFVTLDESDPIWCDIRHIHVAEAAEYIKNGLAKFTADNQAAQWAMNEGGKPPAGSSLREINKLQEALSALPQFQETKARYNLHTDLCSMCIQEFSNRQLSMISGLEQELATGENNEGRATKVFIRSLIEVLDNQSIGKPEKLRLAMTYMIAQNGIDDGERQRILEHPGLNLTDSEKQAFFNLNSLGVRLSRSVEQSRNENKNPFAHLNRLHKIKRPPVEEDLFEGTRYVPSIKSVIEDHLRGAIPEEIFPYTIPPPELPGNSLSDMIKGGGSAPILRSTKPSWATKKTSGAASGSGVGGASSATSMSAAAAPKMYGDKIIVFVLGGISYSEIRSAYELMKSVNREVIIGSTQVYSIGNTPSYTSYNFVEVLKYLHRGSPPMAGTQPRGESRRKLNDGPSSSRPPLRMMPSSSAPSSSSSSSASSSLRNHIAIPARPGSGGGGSGRPVPQNYQMDPSHPGRLPRGASMGGNGGVPSVGGMVGAATVPSSRPRPRTPKVRSVPDSSLSADGGEGLPYAHHGDYNGGHGGNGGRSSSRGAIESRMAAMNLSSGGSSRSGSLPQQRQARGQQQVYGHNTNMAPSMSYGGGGGRPVQPQRISAPETYSSEMSPSPTTTDTPKSKGWGIFGWGK